jgi:hypothetical protein
MKTKIAAGFLGLMIGSAMVPAMAQAEPGSVLSASGGRFVFGQVSAFRRDQFLLDTKTGMLWQIACAQTSKASQNQPAECTGTVLQSVPFDMGTGKLSITPYPAPQ